MAALIQGILVDLPIEFQQDKRFEICRPKQDLLSTELKAMIKTSMLPRQAIR